MAVTGQQDMVLVPRMPTHAMIEAAWADALGEDAVGVWRVMVEEWERSIGVQTPQTAASDCPASDTLGIGS